MPDIYHRPVAYVERESCHPDTGAHGILRREWRIVPYSTEIEDRLAAAFGPDWRRYKPFPDTILESRYIRRGSIETWIPFGIYTNEDAAISDIDDNAIAIDCPPLIWIQHERAKAKREHEIEQERKRTEAAKVAEEVRQRNLSRKTWCKLFNSPRYRPLCDEWNALTSSPGALSIKDDLSSDPEFMRLYRLATIESINTITKRQSMRACIDYYNFMWKHREKGPQS